MKNKLYTALLFDLDGTLLDTACDLIAALNVLTQHPVPITPLLRASAGRGFKGLLKTGLNIEADNALYPSLIEKFHAHYEKCLLNSTNFFPGMAKVLEVLDQKNIPWGIVTNKPTKFTLKIINGLELMLRAKCVISGDTFPNRKPHPEPLINACRLLKTNPADCLYVGDSKSDVQASQAAGITAVVATYGYIAPDDDPSQWKADGYIQRPLEILEWIS